MSAAVLPQILRRHRHLQPLLASLICAVFAAPVPALAQSAPASEHWPLSIVIVDESGSMKNRDAPEWLQQHLVAKAGSADVMYGLVAFSDKARIIDSGAGTLWPASGLVAGFSKLELTRGLEDGLAAVRFALDEFGVFPQAAAHYLLVSDEDRDIVVADLQASELAEELAASGAVLDAMISVSLRCDGRPALGLERSGVAYVADGKGGFNRCNGGFVQDLANSPVKDYVQLAFHSGGTVWDIGMTGWQIDGKHYPPAGSPKKASAVAAYQASAAAHWKRRLEQPLVARVTTSQFLATVGSVIDVDGSGSVSRDEGRPIAQYEWLVNGDATTAGVSGVLVADKAGPMHITLRITDGGFPPRVSEDSVTVWVTE